jgi:hypothetical protein
MLSGLSPERAIEIATPVSANPGRSRDTSSPEHNSKSVVGIALALGHPAAIADAA